MQLLRNYILVHRSPTGTHKHFIADAYSIKWALALNKPGSLSLELPSAYCSSAISGYAISDFAEDDQFLLYRSFGQGFTQKLVGFAPFHLQKIETKRANDGKRNIYVEAVTPLAFLERRINAYDAERNASDLTVDTRPNDNTMKYIVRNNFGSLAESYATAPSPDSVRDLSTYFQVQADTGQSNTTPNYTGQIENAGILGEMQKIADFSASKGIALFFDVVAVTVNPYLLEFRTYINQRGVDRTQTSGGVNAVTLATNINVADYSITFDWSDSVNRVYGSSNSGTGDEKTYVTSSDPNLSTILTNSPFALREDYESSSSDETADIQADADAARVERGNVFQASGLLAENFTQVYGQNFDFGDKVSIYLEDLSFDVFLDRESGEIANGSEKLEVGFSTESTLRKSSGTLSTIISELGYLRKNINKLKRREHI